MPHRLCVKNGIIITFFVLKVGSIHVILDSLDLKGQHEVPSLVTDIGKMTISTIESGQDKPPDLVKNTTFLDKTIKGSHYVRKLIPHNMKNVEFIYEVNFQAGKGHYHAYSLASAFGFKLYYCITTASYEICP